MFQLLTRSQRITYENLLRDPQYMARVDEWSGRAGRGGQRRRAGHAAHVTADPARDDAANRIAVSPMAQYSAVGGMPSTGTSCTSAARRRRR